MIVFEQSRMSQIEYRNADSILESKISLTRNTLLKKRKPIFNSVKMCGGIDEIAHLMFTSNEVQILPYAHSGKISYKNE